MSSSRQYVVTVKGPSLYYTYVTEGSSYIQVKRQTAYDYPSANSITVRVMPYII